MSAKKVTMGLQGKVSNIGLSGIAVPSERLRALRPETVDAIAASFKERGQIHPISVKAVKGTGNGYTLMAGKHRYMAAKKLKWNFIGAVVYDKDTTESEMEMTEIDENLTRADLSPAERAVFVGRRKELYEVAHPKTKQGATGRGGKKDANLASFVDDTAKKTGQSKRKVARDAQRANDIKVIDDVKGTSLDKGTELDALGKLSEAQQRELADKAKAGEKVSAVSFHSGLGGDPHKPVARMKQCPQCGGCGKVPVEGDF